MLKNLLNKKLVEGNQYDKNNKLIEKPVFIFGEEEGKDDEDGDGFEEVKLTPEEEKKRAEDAFFEIMLGKKIDRPLTFVEYLQA